MGTLLIAGLAGAIGLGAAVLLRDHLPDSLKESPTKTGLAVAGAGLAGGALAAYLGYPTVAIATTASLGAAGAFEAVSPMLSQATSDTNKPAPAKGPNQSGTMPAVGPVSPMGPGTLIGDAVNTVAGWLGGQKQGQGSAGQGAYPTFPQLPNGYQDPFGAAVGIAQTVAQHTGAPPGSPVPVTLLPDGGYVLPNGEVIYPGAAAADVAAGQVGRVVQRPVGRVVQRIGCVAPSRIGRVVARSPAFV